MGDTVKWPDGLFVMTSVNAPVAPAPGRLADRPPSVGDYLRYNDTRDGRRVYHPTVRDATGGIHMPKTNTADRDDQPVTTDQLELPAPLLARVERRVDVTEFESASAYVEYVLEELLSRVEPDGEGDQAAEQAIDDAAVQDRLQTLGYME
jgi:Arc/MetJ-type ribon-helix-helix transcriptional regulator